MVVSILERSKKGDLITQIRNDLNLAQELQKSIDSISKDVRPKDYFFVTELVNPTYAYWSRNSNVPTPRNIQEKLSYGKRVHYFSKYWFQKLNGFKFSEASLAGSYVGIDKVSGKIDYFINDSVIELKTKDSSVENVPDLLDRFPQDLEQLLIYSAISSSTEDTHYLIFTVESGKISQRTFKAFEIKIKDHDAIRQFVLRRRDELAQSLLRNDTSQLPKCRYYVSGCKFKENGICNCSNLSHVDAKGLERFITVKENTGLSKELQRIHDHTSINYENNDIDNLWNVLFPMNWYHNKFDFYRDDEYQEDYTSYNKEAAQSLIESALYRSGITVSGSELNSLKEIHALDFEPSRKFIHAIVPGISSYPIPVPYFIKISGSTWIFEERWLPENYLAQAACMAVNSGTKGTAIIVNYPNVNSVTAVYVVIVDSDKVSKAVKSIKQTMKESIQKGSPVDLPRCTDFFRNKCTFDACLCKTT